MPAISDLTQGERYRLYHGDCLEVMKQFHDNYFDACVTDPPYGLNFRDNVWDKNIPEWFQFAIEKFDVVVFTTAPTTMWDYPKPDWVCNWYRPASSSRTAQGGFNHWSPILVYGNIKFDVDSINLHAIANAYPKGFGHPSPKPLRLMRWILENSTNENDIIIDPFMGSGTTGVACAQLGRRFVGIELDPDYFAIAEKRIATAYAQPLLFDAPRAEQEVEQGELL